MYTNRYLLPLGVLLSASVVLAAGPAFGPAKLVCRLPAQITEASGLAASGKSDDYFFVHNDSGGAAAVYAVSRTGEAVATLRLKGASNHDWEDMARGTEGTLYVGDIGDNERKRASVSVYRFEEPPVTKGVNAEVIATRFDLKYPNGAHDAEALLVHPQTGQVVIVTKKATGSGVYATAGALKAGVVNPLKKVGSVNFGALPATIREAKDFLAFTLATGGSFAPDGKRLVVRTYTDAYEWDVKGDMAATFKPKPRRIPLPTTPQGEAITYRADGKGLLIATEGKSAPVHELLRK